MYQSNKIKMNPHSILSHYNASYKIKHLSSIRLLYMGLPKAGCIKSSEEGELEKSDFQMFVMVDLTRSSKGFWI